MEVKLTDATAVALAHARNGDHVDHLRGDGSGAVGFVDDVDHVDYSRTQTGGPDLTDLLDRVDGELARYVAFPSDEARWAVVLWIAHTHAIAAFESTPRLALLSPEKGSGKTRTLEVLELLVPNPLHTVNVSAAALFRKVSEGVCTLLLDEADTYLGIATAVQHEELRGLVNAGHRRGAVAYRCEVGKGVTVKEFPAFAPVALAGIGDLPDTIIDRAVVIAMRRRAPHEQVEPFRHRIAERTLRPLGEAFTIWGEIHADRLADIWPDLPDGITDRAADVWEPLLIIAQDAKDDWPQRGRQAAIAINKARQEKDPSLGVRLLADCRTVYEDKGGDVGTVSDRLTTDDLLNGLLAIDDAPWSDLRGKELDARGLARRLRKYDIRPGHHRFGERAGVKGYLASDFHDAWLRYLPPPSEGQQDQRALETDSFEARYPEMF
jgi:hypothetical protein